MKPTIGRVVLVIRNEPGTPAEPGLITYVHTNGKINVGGFDYTGVPFSARDLTLISPGEGEPAAPYASWMPYQVEKAAEQAAKVEPVVVAAKTSRSKTVAPVEVAPTESPADPAA